MLQFDPFRGSYTEADWQPHAKRVAGRLPMRLQSYARRREAQPVQWQRDIVIGAWQWQPEWSP